MGQTSSKKGLPKDLIKDYEQILHSNRQRHSASYDIPVILAFFELI